MKGSIILLIVIFMAAAASGQQAIQSSLFSSSGNEGIPHVQIHPRPKQANAAHKTTSTTERWYNYGGEYLYWLWNGSSPTLSEIGSEFPFLWFDTSSQNIIGSTLEFNNLVSYGTVFQPWASGFNDTGFAGWGQVVVALYNSYTIDSVEITGVYKRGWTQASTVVDTLRISLVESDGVSGDITLRSTAGPIGPVPSGSTLYHKHMVHDSFYNVAKDSTHFDILLDSASVYDTDAVTYRGGSLIYTGLYHKIIKVPFPFHVPAGHFTGMSVTFKSGDPAAPHMPATTTGYGDTVYTGNPAPGNYRYGTFRPFIAFHKVPGSGFPGIPQFPLYAMPDFNAGVYKQQPTPGWGGLYTSMWGMHGATPADASKLQYAALGFHVTCIGCMYTGAPILGISSPSDMHNLKSICDLEVTPNPANGLLNISFTQADGTTASITLTNMVGQIVFDQSITNGKAVINTSALPAGMYIYNVRANGGRATGRVVIAH